MFLRTTRTKWRTELWPWAASSALPPDNPLSVELTGLAFAFMLILCRCAGAVMLLPGFGEEELPVMLRAGFATCLAVLLTPSLAPRMGAPPPDFFRLAGMIAAELLVGGLIGWLARLLALALAASGQVIGLLVGLSSVLLPDATFGAQSSAIGKLLNLAAPVLILSTGLYAMPLAALADSYTVFPPGGALPAGDLAQVAVRAVAASFALALRLTSPFILMSLVWQISLGLLARLVPQIQVYFAALPGQVLGGMLLLALLSAPILRAWLMAVHEGYAALPGL
jgi:flagellar biosynthetic protein FliR